MGILEISNIFNDLYGFDEEYYGIILSTFLNQALISINSKEILKIELK